MEDSANRELPIEKPEGNLDLYQLIQQHSPKIIRNPPLVSQAY